MSDIDAFIKGLFDAIPVGAAASSIAIGSTVLFMTSASFKKRSWVAPRDIVVTKVQKLPGSTGNCIVATTDLASANLSQFADGDIKSGAVIYADQAAANVGDTVGGLLCAFLVKTGQMITVWHETTSIGGVLLSYVDSPSQMTVESM